MLAEISGGSSETCELDFWTIGIFVACCLLMALAKYARASVDKWECWNIGIFGASSSYSSIHTLSLLDSHS
jgi:hypothetical protein